VHLAASDALGVVKRRAVNTSSSLKYFLYSTGKMIRLDIAMKIKIPTLLKMLVEVQYFYRLTLRF
jgi:hypothetical protein